MEQDIYLPLPNGRVLKCKESQKDKMLELLRSYRNGTLQDEKMKSFLDELIKEN